MKKLVAAVALLFTVPASVSGQNADHQSRGQGYIFFGLGTANRYYSCYHCSVIEHIGLGGEGFLYKGFGVGVEVGYAHWGPYDNQAWIGSGDASYHFRRSAPRCGVDPFVLIGVAGYFPTSQGRGTPAGKFGGGANLWLKEHAALRLEVLDHFSNGNFGLGSHYISFRVGVTFR